MEIKIGFTGLDSFAATQSKPHRAASTPASRQHHPEDPSSQSLRYNITSGLIVQAVVIAH